MNRQTMFEMQENSIDLLANTINGLQTIDEEEHRRELSAHEKKEFDRKKRFGKIGGTFFTKAEMSNNNDVIAAGVNFAVTQEQEEQTVQIRNLSDEDIDELKKKHLLDRFDKGTMLSPEIQEEAKAHFSGGPTVIQKYVIPLILYTSKDIIARAKTGSGKSAAFILPLIELIHKEKLKEPEEKRKQPNGSAPYAIIFEPTRELCIQLAKEVRRLAKGTSVKVAFSFGTIDMASSYRMVRTGADILIGTPSRVNHMFFGIEGNKIHESCFDFSNLKYLVLDEADRLVDQAEFHTYSYPFKERLADNGARVFMFSATDGDCESGKQMFTDDPIEVIVGGEEAPVRNIVQAFVEYDPNNTKIVSYKRFDVDCPITKMDYLVALLDRYVTRTDEAGYKRVPTTIVFVQNKRSSDSVAIWLLRRGFRATALNSDRETKNRIQSVRGIQSGHYDIVVATDVLARGINIPGVETVINYELPHQSPLNYVHRIGRTARMGNIGRVVSFFNTGKDTNLAPYLEKWLKDCDQEVPTFLYNVSFEMTAKAERSLMNNGASKIINGIPEQRTVLDDDMEF